MSAPGAATHELSYETKVKGYLKVFYILIVITVLEVGVVLIHLPHLLTTLIVVGLSLLKAFMVGYYFMHLNHETSWLKFVAVLPACMFFYAAVLIPDVSKRPISIYSPEPPRVFLNTHSESNDPSALHGTAESPTKAPAAPAAPTNHSK